MTKLIPPHPGAVWNDPHGNLIAAGPDGTVEVSEIYVASLIDAGYTRAPVPPPSMPFNASDKGKKDVKDQI